MAVIFIKSKSDLPAGSEYLRFKLSKDSDWIYGVFSPTRERFIDNQGNFTHVNASYHWEGIYAYQLPSSGFTFED